LLAILLVVFAHNVFASGAGEHSASPAPPASAQSLKPIVHIGSAPPDFRPAPPVGVRIPERYLDYDHSPETSSARFIEDEPSKARHFARMAAKTALAATAACDVNTFANASTSTIGESVRTSDLSCINALFSVSGTTAASVFSESKMIAVANYANSYAANYPGDNSTGVEQFATFLRAGYYVQFYNSAAVPAYSPNVTTAVDAYLDAFIANAHFYDVNDNHGVVLNEVLTLTASSSQQARYVGTYKSLLARYNSSYNTSYYMKGSIDQVFSAIFNGAWVPSWVSLVNSDTSIVSTLNDFVTRTSFNANTSDEWLTRDAAAELAHFLDGSTYASNVVSVARPLVRTVIQTYNYTNNGVSIFIAAVAGQDYYDKANCSYYGTCTTKSQVMGVVQGQSYQCPSDAIKIVAQNMTTQQFSDTCATLHNEIPYIHGMFKDPGPIAGKTTVGLEVDVFNSSADYATYGAYLYGISTSNGGLSIEGDPSRPGNIAHFYCYHAEWITADWEIWNLWHEFTHYMDSKYNQGVAFGDEPTTNASLPYSEVWWIEGIAEYVSYSYRNLVDSEAVTVAGNHTYSLPRLFDNTYDMANYQEAAYPGGYLSVNFMINNHRADIDTMLGMFRAGSYSTSYHTFLDGIRNSYTSEFESFETCFKNNNGTGGCSSPSPAFSISASAASVTSGSTGASTVTESITNGFNSPVALTASGLPSGVTAAFNPTSITGAGNSTLTFTAASSAVAGTYTITVVGTSASGTAQATTLTLTVRARSSATVTLGPSSFDFGTVAVNEYSNWQAFTLTNTGSTAASISNATVSGPFDVSNACSLSVAAGSQCTIWVLFAPTSSGVFTGRLTVTDNAANSPQTVTLTGTGGVAGSNISFSGTIAAQGGYVFTPNFTSGAGTVTATLNVPAGTSWRFVANDATTNQAMAEQDGAGPLTITFTAIAGHSYNFFLQATAGSGAWSTTGTHP